MKQTVSNSDFIDAFRAHNRYALFGYEALNVLFKYLEQYEEDCGQEIELDVVALCCEYAVDTVEDIAANYDVDIDGMDEDEAKDTVLEYLNENTQVCGECDAGIVYCTAF
jgi:hypothetical protein